MSNIIVFAKFAFVWQHSNTFLYDHATNLLSMLTPDAKLNAAMTENKINNDGGTIMGILCKGIKVK